MIENVLSTEELKSLSRRKNHDREFQTVRNQDVAEHVTQGWGVQRQNKMTTRLSRPKRREILLEDRVWTLLYAMGFTHLSGERGALLHLHPKGGDDGVKNQIDVVGLDSEIAIAVECKSSSKPRRNAKFQEFLAKHSVIRDRFANATNDQFPLDHKRVPVLAIFTWDLLLSENDVERAQEQMVAFLNENDLDYYEQLVSHLGPAAKYQFFADLLRGKQIHGLRLAIPAIETRMGKHTCYSFSITPEYLLKIAYVAPELCTAGCT